MRKNAALNLDPILPEKPKHRKCEHPGCKEIGEFPAPRSRTDLDNRIWLCLDHVREHNSQWDYCEGLSEREIEDLVRRDATWQRQTSKLGRWGNIRAEDAWKATKAGAKDKYGFFDDDDPDNPFAKARRRAHGEREKEGERRRNRGLHGNSEEEKALELLDLSPPVTFDEIRARYKYLVKRLHPDANGGDPLSEQKMKTINHAYSVLKRAYSTFRDSDAEREDRDKRKARA